MTRGLPLDEFTVAYLKLAAKGYSPRRAAELMAVDVADIERALGRMDAEGRGRGAAGTPSVHALPAEPSPGYTDPDAACRGKDPGLFFGPDGERHGRTQARREAQARAVCKGCPVRVACLRWALDNNVPFGVWGGLTEMQRRVGEDAEPARSLPTRCGNGHLLDDTNLYYVPSRPTTWRCRSCTRDANARGTARKRAAQQAAVGVGVAA